MERILPCPVSPSYEVSDEGRVRRIGKSAWLQPATSKRGGYLTVNLWESGHGKTRTVHQLVALTFIGPRPSERHDAAHWDGDKQNNRSTNLRWATRAENEADKVRHGRANRGERNGVSKVSDAQAAEIRNRVSTAPRSSGGGRVRKGTLQSLAAEFGVTTSAVSQIANGSRRSAT